MAIDPSMLKAFQDDALEILASWEKTCLDASRSPAEATYQSLMRCAHNLKGNAGLIGFDALSQTMHRLEDQLLQLHQHQVNPSSPKLIGILLDIEKFIRSWIAKVIENPNYQPDHINWLIKLQTFEAGGGEAAGRETNEASSEPVKERTAEGQSQGGGDGGAGQSVETLRIPANKLDRLIQLVGELTLAQAIVTRGRAEDRMNAPEVREAIGLCDKITRNLRTAVLDLRMLPMAGLFQKLERAAMETSVRVEKPFQFVARGQDVTLDKVVLERIFDPLMHIVRNAIDHGLEGPEEREKSGKPREGTVQITAELGATGVVVKIQDDGRGLNPQRIVAKAIERGILKSEETLSETEIFSLIFKPGFSTAEQVTDISGRGVGLDVVQKEVNRLGGQVQVESWLGIGTQFNISLPTNISLIDVLVVKAGGATHAIPTQDLSEILSLAEHPLQSSVVFERMLVLRNRVVPVELLSRFLPTKAEPVDNDANESSILVVEFQGESVGFLVDTVLAQQQVFVRPLKGYLASLPWLTGATILSTGEPSMILNLTEMAKDYWTGMRRGRGHADVTT